MKWKGKKKNDSSKNKSSPSTPPSTRSSAGGAAMGPSTPGVSGTSISNGPGLGTLRVGMIRLEPAPICTPTPRAKRQLISDLLGADEGEETGDGHVSVTASPSLRSIISNRTSSGKKFDRESGAGDSFSSYTPEEKVAFACHLNQHLLGDPFLKHLLPLDAGGADFFCKFNDGVLMCRLVCLAIPGSIADSKINVPTGAEPLGLYKSTENLNVALTAAEAAGLQVVNIGAADIIEGRPASILGLSWQLIRVHLLAQINLKGCPDLIHLMEEGEEKEHFYQLPAEDILLRWFNHHLRWAGSERRVSNFGDDLADGRCYVTLIKELNDNFKGEESDGPDEDAKRAQFRRACLVISGAEGIGLAPLIRPRHINGKAILYNIAFVAQLFNRRPRIHRESLHLQASVTMQSWFRMARVMRETTPLIEERRESASTLSRAYRRWARCRNQQRAATVLQAWERGRKGRAVASSRRFVVAQAAAQRAVEGAKAREREAAARKQEAAAREQEAAAREQEAAKLELEAAAAQERKAEAREREREAGAATALQAWARGMDARQAVTEALLARGMPLLGADRQRRDSSGVCLKDSQAGQSISPRTSVSSSVRFSEDSPVNEALLPFAGGAGGGGRRSVGEKSGSWFDKVFSGISFGGTSSSSSRGRDNPRRQEAAAAMVIQRWRHRVRHTRAEAARAQEEVAKRRWAVGKLHWAYASRWRFEVAVRREKRQELEKEEEARKKGSGKAMKGPFAGLWAEIRRGVLRRSGGEDTEEKSGIFGKKKRPARQNLEVEESADCCDAIGQGVLASEIEAWKFSYIAEQVLGSPTAGKAQEARAFDLSKIGYDDQVWSSPENALSTGKVVAMISVIMTVLFETAFSNAAALGA